MPELKPNLYVNTTKEGHYGNSAMNIQTSSLSNCHLYTYNHYPPDFIFRNLNSHSKMTDPGLQGLVETEVFVGGEDENFLLDDQSHLEGITPSPLMISYHKDSVLHPLNSVKEDVEAEAAEEEVSGNFHSLDYLGLSMGPSSLSSSVMSSVSLDEVNLHSGLEQLHQSNTKHQMRELKHCPNLGLTNRSSLGAYDTSCTVSRLKSGHSNSNGKLSPASFSKVPSNSLKNGSDTYSKEESGFSRTSCCKNSSQKSFSSLDRSKVALEKRNPIWHNPSKADKLSTSKKESSSTSQLKRYSFCRAKSDAKDSSACNESKFSSLPRKKKEKNEKDIAAETYGTLGRNRRKKDPESNSRPQSLVNERHVHDLPQESKNILDKYATLPRKKAKEISSRWREQSCQKETRPPLQRSKSTGKSESSRSVRSSPSPSLSASSTSSISSPRNISTSTKHSTNKISNKVLAPSAKLLARQNNGAGKDRPLSSSIGAYSVNKQPRITRNLKKNAQVQVNLQWDPEENEMEEKLRKLSEENSLLQSRLRTAEANAEEVEQMRMEAVELRREAENERLEKEEIQEELDRTSGKVREMLTSMEGVEKEFNNRGESLVELENKLVTSSEFNIKMQEKLNQYEEYTVKLRKDLDKSLAAQKILLQQVQDLEAEGREMVEFMAEEKNALSECLKEAELELFRQRKEMEELSSKLMQKEDEARHMVRLAEERRVGYVSLQTELKSVQSSAEDMMVCQGAQLSGASVGLTNLTSRLTIITGRLVQDYSISENDIENVVTPTDSDSSFSSSANGTPDQQRSPLRSAHRVSSSPRKPASFMQSFLNAMRSARTASKLLLAAEKGKDGEDRRSPEGSEPLGLREVTKAWSSSSSSSPQQSLSDQVSEVDVLLTRFMKVCCVLKSDADNILTELEDENERLCSQIHLQQQMIEQQYAEFESLSNLEVSARKELRLITKDLEFANETLNKVCDDETKTRVKNIDEALRAINSNLSRMDTMHAEKRDKLAHSRISLPVAQDLIHSPNSVKSPNAKRPQIRFPMCNMKETKGKRGSRNSSEEEEDEEGRKHDVDSLVNEVLKTLETIPDIVSGSSPLKSLYLQLTSTHSAERDVNCNPSVASFSRPQSSTCSVSSRFAETHLSALESCGSDTPSNKASLNLDSSSDVESFMTATSSLHLSSPSPTSTIPCTNGNGNHISQEAEGTRSYHREISNVTVDCNANPEIVVTERPNENHFSNSADPVRFIPLLTNETSL